MSNLNHKKVEFDSVTVAMVTVLTVLFSATVYLVLLGPILQLPAPLGPTILLSATAVTSVIAGVVTWCRERKSFLRKIHSALNLGSHDKTPYIPILPSLRSHYFEFDGEKSRRVPLSHPKEFSTIYYASSSNFEVINLIDRNPTAVWDRTLTRIDSTYNTIRN